MDALQGQEIARAAERRRNIEVRKGYRIDVKKDPARVIDMPCTKE